MPHHDPIEVSLQRKFGNEKLARVIKECNDIDLLRNIAIELVKLNEQKTAIAEWATKRAIEAEKFR